MEALLEVLSTTEAWVFTPEAIINNRDITISFDNIFFKIITPF